MHQTSEWLAMKTRIWRMLKKVIPTKTIRIEITTPFFLLLWILVGMHLMFTGIYDLGMAIHNIDLAHNTCIMTSEHEDIFLDYTEITDLNSDGVVRNMIDVYVHSIHRMKTNASKIFFGGFMLGVGFGGLMVHVMGKYDGD